MNTVLLSTDAVMIIFSFLWSVFKKKAQENNKE